MCESVVDNFMRKKIQDVNIDSYHVTKLFKLNICQNNDMFKRIYA